MKKGLALLILILFVIAGGTVYYSYFMENDTVVPAFQEGKTTLVVEGDEVISIHEPRVVDNEILLPLDVVKKYFDPNIFWDDRLKKVTVTTRDRVIRMKTDNLTAMINNKPVTLNIPVRVENDTVYIPIEFLKDFYSIEISYLKENNVVVIDYKNSIRQIAEAIDPNAVIRTGRSKRYPILKKFRSDDNMMRVFDEYEKWYKIRASDGTVGFIEKRFVVVRRMIVAEPLVEQKKETAWKPDKGKINLVWEMAWKPVDTSGIPKMDGVDVVSPTWFTLGKEDGLIFNKGDLKYVEWAHKNGYKVWALFSNGFDADLTDKVLSDTDKRDNVIRQLLAFAGLYKLDGINIDFESMKNDDKDLLTQFVREMTPFLKEQGLVVSIDVTPISVNTAYYDRPKLAEVVDYVMVMTYDQHWKTSPESGSVAQFEWAEGCLKKVLEQVPPEKLLLGIPFYTREWKEEKDQDGKIKVSSAALGMDDAAKRLKDNNAKVVWDEKSGQFYGEYSKDGAVYKIWLEDANSINLKSSLVHKYRLAGAAAWARGYETPDIWQALNRNLKQKQYYQEWQTEYASARYEFR